MEVDTWEAIKIITTMVLRRDVLKNLKNATIAYIKQGTALIVNSGRPTKKTSDKFKCVSS